MSTDEHFLIRHQDPPVYGDRPEPWRVYYTCGCGAELWDDEEGRGSTPGTPDDALAKHIAEETGTCGCGADLEEEACPNSPDACLDCCGEDHAGPEPTDAKRIRAAALAVSAASSRPAIAYLQNTPGGKP